MHPIAAAILAGACAGWFFSALFVTNAVCTIFQGAYTTSTGECIIRVFPKVASLGIF